MKDELEKIKKEALDYYKKAAIVLSDDEIKTMEIADMGLNDFQNFFLPVMMLQMCLLTPGLSELTKIK